MDKKSYGFTLIELLITIIIGLILLSVILPAITAVREQGRRIQCFNNLRQHGLAWHMYFEEHNGCFPIFGKPIDGGAGIFCFGGKPGTLVDNMPGYQTQYRILNKYLESTAKASPNLELFHCPDDKPIPVTLSTNFKSNGNSYIANVNILSYSTQLPGLMPRPLSTITCPHNMVYLERDQISNYPGHGNKGQEGNKTPVMILFVDGHVAGPFKWDEDVDTLLYYPNTTKKVLDYPNTTEDAFD